MGSKTFVSARDAHAEPLAAMKPKIKVRYTCGMCGIKRMPVDVDERDDGQDVTEWLKLMSFELVADHRKRSPDCHPLVFDEVMIPTDEHTPVGKARTS